MNKKIFLRLLCGCAALFLGGCTRVEPEKRAYPLVLAVDEAAGEYRVSYGMPNMAAVTGQEQKKGSKEEAPENLTFAGRSREEIEEEYLRTQEKYLDLSHVQAVILGDDLVRAGHWRQVLNELRADPAFGEDLCLFRAADPEAVMARNGVLSSSLGEYLTGLYENRPKKQTRVTLRAACGKMFADETLLPLPRLFPDGEGIRADFASVE